MRQLTHLKLFWASFAFALLSACGNNTSTTSETGNAVSKVITSAAAVDAFRPLTTETNENSAFKIRDLSTAPVATNIVLGAPASIQTTTVTSNNTAAAENNMGKPLQIGFGRVVAQTATATATQRLLSWNTNPSGSQVAAINFSSTGAKGMRIGLLINQIPDTAVLRFYSKGAPTAFEVQGSEVLAVIAKNLAAGDKTDAGRTYWAPAVDGADATIEIEIPKNVASSAVSIAVPSISHIFMSNKEINTATAQINYTGDTNAGLSCQIDVTCSSPRPAATDAVVHIRFNEGALTYICSGTMLNDSINSATPYLLTANHCISSQTVASTMTTWFKYRSTTCNDGTAGEYYPTYGGATLLYTAYGTDSTLLKLNNSPSVSGILYAGWDATTAPTVATSIHSVHHPRGDQQRLSRGSITSYSSRSSTSANTFFGSDIANGSILDVTLTTGLTEGGSSGSGLFKGTDANPQLIGQLFGGSTPACGSPKYNVYGRFDIAYNAGMSDWLMQGIKPINRFFNTQTGAHFYSISATETNSIKTNLPQFNYEGTPFKASTITGAGLSPVYRFFNTRVGVHFFTNSDVERDNVITNLPVYQYEEIGWYAYANNAVGTVPLYRFFNTSNGVHFYTISTAERDSVIANLKQFNYEGIAYYVLP
ncbi:MAG: hypothetical protein RL535_1267 [Pseudomonadota bacterium]